MNHAQLRVLSLRLERQTGYDSIPTIEEHYKDGNSYLCVWPGCKYRRSDPGVMWYHVHFGPHGLSFGVAEPTWNMLPTTGYDPATGLDDAARAALTPNPTEP